MNKSTTARKPVDRNGAGKPQYGKNRGTNRGGQDQQPMTLGESLWSWVKTIISSLLIVMVINGLLIASFVVPTGSMENEVMAGDFLFVNKFVYGGSSPQTVPFINLPLPYFRLPGLRDPQKGDVIVFIFPGDRNEAEPADFQYYLKRCVATAGDMFEIRDKDIYINGELQPRPPNAIFSSHPPHPNDAQRTFPPYRNFTRDNWGPMRIPKEGDVIPLDASNYEQWKIFIMREGHEVGINGEIITIDGQVATSYTVERDYCFGMGDNRDESLDSRYFGFIPVENVVGTPMFVYWSWDPNVPITQLGEKLGSIRWNRIFTGVE